MRFLKIIVIVGVPLLIVLNLVTYFYYGEPVNADNFKGFGYVRDGFATFNLFNHFLENIVAIRDGFAEIVGFSDDWWNWGWTEVGKYLQVIGMILLVPLSFVVDIFVDIIQLIGFIMGWRVTF